MSRQSLLLISLLFIITPWLFACATRTQSQYYESEVGRTMPIEDVVILSSRLVRIEGLSDQNKPGWGAAIGAAVAGAGAYGITESDNPAGVAITIIALIGGALAGQFIDEKASASMGVEYTLSKTDGTKIAVVQSIKDSEEQLPAGSLASMIRGQQGYVRIIPR